MITKVLALLSLALVISLSQCTGVCWEVALEPIWMESVAQVRRIIVQILLKFFYYSRFLWQNETEKNLVKDHEAKQIFNI